MLKLRSSGMWLCALVFPLVAWGHGDDPKVLNREPRYEGPGYRQGQRDFPEQFAFDNVELLAWMPLPEFGQNVNTGNDCWGYVSPSGREYAIFGNSDNTAFVEVTDPGNPQIVALIDGPDSLWRDIKVYQNYAYIVSEGGSGIQVVNMSNIDNGQVTLVRTVNGFGTSNTHNVAINEASGYLYRCGGGDNGLRIYSLANPGNPQFVRAWTDRYVHDAQIVTYTSGPYAGREIAFCCSGYNGGQSQTGLDIVDVTNKNNLINLGRLQYPNNRYSHQCWLSEDGRYVFLNDELDEPLVDSRMIIIDVSDLSNPTFAGSFSNGNEAVTHNLYVKGNQVYAANYRSGLRVFDITNPLQPSEVAYFDTYPLSDFPYFNGLWSTYPYFPSGTVIGSDLERGLFIWRVDIPPIAFDIPDKPSLIDPAGGTTIAVRVFGREGATVDAASVRMLVDTGAGFAEVALTESGGEMFSGEFPGGPCGAEARYYFVAASTDGDVVTAPANGAAGALTVRIAQSQTVAFADDLTVDTGWTVGLPADTAVRGQWALGDPRGTGLQPDGDHTQNGSLCFVTDPRTGLSTAEYDVDGGFTTLISPPIDLAGTNKPLIGYWRWYWNSTGPGANEDVFTVDISDDDGTTWRRVETVGPTGVDTAGGWFYHEFLVSDFVAATGAVRLRFVAADEGSNTNVEAAIDDLQVLTLECGTCAGDLTGDGRVDFDDFSVLSACFGSACGDLTGDATTDFADFAALAAGWGCEQ